MTFIGFCFSLKEERRQAAEVHFPIYQVSEVFGWNN